MSRGSDPTKVAQWEARFARHAQSDLSTIEFCAAEGVTTASYYAWRRKLGLSTPRAPKPAAPSAFQQLFVSPSATALSARLPGGIEIDVPLSHEASLRTVVSELVHASRSIAAGQLPC
jgi:hypothetical protein